MCVLFHDDDHDDHVPARDAFRSRAGSQTPLCHRVQLRRFRKHPRTDRLCAATSLVLFLRVSVPRPSKTRTALRLSSPSLFQAMLLSGLQLMLAELAIPLSTPWAHRPHGLSASGRRWERYLRVKWRGWLPRPAQQTQKQRSARPCPPASPENAYHPRSGRAGSASAATRHLHSCLWLLWLRIPWKPHVPSLLPPLLPLVGPPQ